MKINKLINSLQTKRVNKKYERLAELYRRRNKAIAAFASYVGPFVADKRALNQIQTINENSAGLNSVKNIIEAGERLRTEYRNLMEAVPANAFAGDVEYAAFINIIIKVDEKISFEKELIIAKKKRLVK